jgi:hypothetical protein
MSIRCGIAASSIPFAAAHAPPMARFRMSLNGVKNGHAALPPGWSLATRRIPSPSTPMVIELGRQSS